MDQQVCPVETPRWKPPMVGFHLKSGNPPVHTALKGYKKSKFHFLVLASKWNLHHENKV